MKQQTQQQTNNEPIWEDCIEYFMGQQCEFKFVYSDAQIPTAEELINDINKTEDKN